MRRRNQREQLTGGADASGGVTAFLPDETAGAAIAAAAALEARVATLEQQLLAQYSAMASYATIAQQAVDVARAEARADLDRSQAMLTALIDQLRRETPRADAGALADGGGLRARQIDALGSRIDELAASLEQVVAQHRALASSVGAVLERQMSAQGWLVSSGSAESLAMH